MVRGASWVKIRASKVIPTRHTPETTELIGGTLIDIRLTR